jgi:hypothetical protein
MAPFRTDIKSETMWCATFDGNPLTIDILLDFFLKAHADNCEPSIQRQGKGKILGSVQPVIQALLYYLANASQISQLEDLLLDHKKEGSFGWIHRQMQNYKRKDLNYVDITKGKSSMATQTILGSNVQPFKFKEIEIIGNGIFLKLFFFGLMRLCEKRTPIRD